MATIAGNRIRGRERDELANELRQKVNGEVRFDPFSRVLYSTDASIYQMEPVGVVIPRDVDDVVAVMQVAHENKIPVLPRAGGTSLAGQCVNHAIVMDFSKYMNQLIEVNEEEHWAKVQPGIVLDQLNKLLLPYNLHYAPDPTTASRACVGGGIGNNTCGAHSVIYGKTLDHVKELDVVLSDANRTILRELNPNELENKLSGTGLESDIYRGVLRIAKGSASEIESRYPKILRRVSGYNLDDFLHDGPINMAKMAVGSEGTLCVTTEAKINLVPRPTMTALSVIHFPDIFEASEATKEILTHDVSVVEIMDKMLLDRCRESLGFAQNLSFIQGDPGALLLVEFYGESELELKSKLDVFKSDMERRRLGYACVNLLDKPSQNNVWNIRKAGLGLLMSIHGDAKPLPYVEDTAVDPQKLGPFVRRFDEIVRNHNTEAGYYGHASVGCLHIRPLVSLKEENGLNRMMAIADEISDLVKEFGGSLSGEHGDGIVRGVWTEKMFGPEITQAFRDVKSTFDPDGIMNPGKIIDCPPLTENLRYGTSYSTIPVNTTLDFSLDSDYAGAVEMCNGMGACRKLEGTMCPSYMATRDEEHSTRGRANLLRAALSGNLPEGTITSSRLYETLDLCLECKGCKSECPSGVDMAKLKYEFLDKYYQTNKLPIRTRVFANINKINKLGTKLPGLSNWVSNSSLGRLVSSKFLGVHPNRQLPRFASTTFQQWFNNRQTIERSSPSTGTVVLYNDTFMNYNYPSIGQASVKLLEHAGYEVVLANADCCGRPMISKGLLDEAKIRAEANIDALAGYVKQGFPIIGTEPSCILTFRDEYPELIKTENAKLVGDNSYMIDEFLSMLHQKGELNLNFTTNKKQILFHGHCHQKSLIGTSASLAVLNLPANYEAQLINAGCCGMAGSFGFEKEHYDISMQIGEQALFPAINHSDDDCEIAVTGVSCRQQVEHGTDRKPRHIAEILAEALQ